LPETSFEKCPLRRALAALESRTPELIERFHEHLEIRASGLKTRLYGADDERLRGILLNVIVLVAETHEEPDEVSETVRRLGERHRGLGLSLEHFKEFGEALREAIATVLGEEWTPQANWLWRRAFRRVALQMVL